MRKIFLAFFLLLFPFFSQAKEGIQVLSNDQYVNLEPGGARHFVLEIKNNTAQTLDISIKVTGLQATGFTEGGATLSSKEGNVLANDWLKILSEPQFSLAPQQTKKVSFLVSVSREAQQGGYYAGIYFEDKKQKIKSRMVLVALAVERAENKIPLRSGKLLSLTHPHFLFYGPVDIQAKFLNTGKIHYFPQGEVSIFNVFNMRSGYLRFASPMSFPQEEVTLSTHWPRKYLLGKYLVVARVFDGDGHSYLISSTFWAFPWQELSI